MLQVQRLRSSDEICKPNDPTPMPSHMTWWNYKDSLPIRRIRHRTGNADGVCSGTHLDRLSDRVSLPCATTLRPSFCGRTGRPRRRSNLARNASEPTGGPVPSAARSAAKASGSAPHGHQAAQRRSSAEARRRKCSSSCSLDPVGTNKKVCRNFPRLADLVNHLDCERAPA
jgi:hypothetical protein